MSQQIKLADENAMMALAGKLAAGWVSLLNGGLDSPVIVYLRGDLGAGKTTFTRGFLRACGYEGIVKSPTYTLLEPYQVADKTVYHFDLYRLGHPEELEFTGARDCFTGTAISLIEWPGQAETELPDADIECDIQIDSNSRILTIKSHSTIGNAIMLQSFSD